MPGTASRAWHNPGTVGDIRRMGQGLLTVALLFSTGGCGFMHRDAGIADKIIRYEVGFISSPDDRLSHSALSISYSTNDGQQEQTNVALPWTKGVGAARPGFTAKVRAQFDGFGTIECRIVADGKVIDERVSAGDPYPVVECSSDRGVDVGRALPH